MANQVLIPQGSAELELLARSYEQQLRAIDPAWGMFPNARPWCFDPPPDGVPPEGDCLRLEAELLRMLEPAGEEVAAKAAAVIIASYPQADSTEAAYALALVRHLRRAPHDLLDRIVEDCADAGPYRPAPGTVKEIVAGHVARRQTLLGQVRAALRYHAHQRALAEAEPELMVPITTVLLERIRGEAASGVFPVEQPKPRPIVDRRPLTPEQLAALRKARARSAS